VLSRPNYSDIVEFILHQDKQYDLPTTANTLKEKHLFFANMHGFKPWLVAAYPITLKNIGDFRKAYKTAS
jgi:hypothetical protein